MTERGRTSYGCPPTRIAWHWTILLAVPMVLLTAMTMTQGQPLPKELRLLIPLIVSFVFLNAMFILMLRSGRIDQFRSPVFILYALGLVMMFIPNMLEVRGTVAIGAEEIVQGKVPFCHMVIPMTIIPAAFTRTIIFPGSMLEGFASIGTMLVLWLVVSIVLGRGWCSWVCFYGGLDEGFSRILRTPLIRRISPTLRYVPFAVLLVIVLLSAVYLTPTYCEWLCPYKSVTEFAAVTDARTLIQTVIFVALFVGLVIILPILTGKRTQCGLFCPMGAFQSFTNKVNIFGIRIDKDKCIQCGACIKACPTLSLDQTCLEKGSPRMTCSKCGRCVDVCKFGAVSMQIKGTPPGHPNLGRVLFVYPAFLVMAIMGGSMIQQGLYRIILLVTTGSLVGGS
ncbi:MAG: 4Fe-4S binding protein [Phycisphaerae bacterium]|nr:4Fe-4S binding protein [Phycisphaerae bacterium]